MHLGRTHCLLYFLPVSKISRGALKFFFKLLKSYKYLPNLSTVWMFSVFSIDSIIMKRQRWNSFKGLEMSVQKDISDI